MSNQNDSWDVEEIIDRKYVENEPYYLLKWKNFDHSANTWEPVSHLNCTELLDIFEAQRSDQLEAYKRKHALEIGFSRGLEPEFVIGVTKVRNKLLYGVKWVDNTDADIIGSEEVTEKCPHLILEFYLESIGYRPNIHAGSEAQDHQSTEKKVRLNGGSHSTDGYIEPTPLFILQQKLDNGFMIDTIKSVIQDPITKDIVYEVHWYDITEDDYVPADFAHRFCQREVIKYFEKQIYFKENHLSNMISDIGPALESQRLLS